MSSYSPADCQSRAGRIAAASMRRLTIVSLDEWLTLTARAHPDRPAVIAGGRAATYRELDEAAARVARRLAAVGVGPGDRVATTLPPGHDFAELLHALP